MNINNDSSIYRSYLDEEIERLVGATAATFHLSRSEELTFEIPGIDHSRTIRTENYEVNAGIINFVSIEARNRVVAEHCFRDQKIEFENKPSKYFKIARELWQCEIGRKDSAAGRLLARVNETHDIFRLCSQLISEKEKNVFLLLGTLESAFPYLDCLSVEGIWEVCVAQHELTKSDAAGGVFFGKLRSGLVTHATVCRDIHLRLRNELTDSTVDLHLATVGALAESSSDDALRLTLEDIQSNNSLLRRVALWTLGQLIVSAKANDAWLSLSRAAIVENLSNADEIIRHTAMRVAAIVSIVSDCFIGEIQQLADGNDSLAIAAIVEAVWRHFEVAKSRAFFHHWIQIGSRTPAAFTGTLGQLDHNLSRLLSDATKQEIALSCLKAWVEANGTDTPRNDAFPELFNLTTLKLMESKSLLSRLLTDWLLADGFRLPAAAVGLLSYATIHGFKKPEFDTDKLDTLDKDDLLFLARRLVGYIYSEHSVISLAISLFNTRDPKGRIFPFLRSLLVDEIGYDYPHSMIEELTHLKNQIADAESESFISTIIESIQARLTVAESLPPLNELRPPAELQRRLSRAYAKRMSKATKGAQENSLIRQLATVISIKGGTGYFNFQDGSYSEPSYLKTFSQSMTVPKRHVLDSIGYDIHLLQLRLAKRGEEE